LSATVANAPVPPVIRSVESSFDTEWLRYAEGIKSPVAESVHRRHIGRDRYLSVT
jgi:hypothetical protein